MVLLSFTKISSSVSSATYIIAQNRGTQVAFRYIERAVECNIIEQKMDERFEQQKRLIQIRDQVSDEIRDCELSLRNGSASVFDRTRLAQLKREHDRIQNAIQELEKRESVHE